MGEIKNIARNTTFLAAGDIFSKILSLILVIYIARHLGDVGMGEYSFALAFTGLFAVLTNAGFGAILTRDLSRNLSQTNLANIVLVSRLLLSIFTVLMIMAAAYFFDYPGEIKIVIVLFGLSIIFTTMVSDFSSVFLAFQKTEFQAITVIVERIFTCSIGILILKLGYGLIPLALVMLTGSVLSFLVSLSIAWRKFFKPRIMFDSKIFRYFFIAALPLTLVNVFTSVYSQIDVILLETMKGYSQVGWYNAAYRLVSSLTFLPNTFMVSMFPVLSRFSTTSESSLKLATEKSFKYLLIIAIPMAVGTTLLANKIIWTFYTDKFNQSIPALRVLIWMEALIFLSLVAGVVMIAINRQSLIAYITLFAAILNVALNWLLIPHYGYMGAAFAGVATQFSVLAFDIYVIRRYLYKIGLFSLSLKPAVAGSIMGIFLIYFNTFSLPILVFIGIFIYFAALYAIKGADEEDIRLVRELVKK